MSDWDDRIRDSSRYLDRMQDQIDFVKTQSDTRDAVYDGIINGDEFGTRVALGIPAAATDRFDEHLQSLIAAVGASRMPDAEGWATRLQGIVQSAAAQRVLHAFATEYDRYFTIAKDSGGIDLEIEKDRIRYDVRALWEMVGGV